MDVYFSFIVIKTGYSQMSINMGMIELLLYPYTMIMHDKKRNGNE